MVGEAGVGEVVVSYLAILPLCSSPLSLPHCLLLTRQSGYINRICLTLFHRFLVF